VSKLKRLEKTRLIEAGFLVWFFGLSANPRQVSFEVMAQLANLYFILLAAGTLVGCGQQDADVKEDVLVSDVITEDVLPKKVQPEPIGLLLERDIDYGKAEIGSWWMFQDTSGQWTLTSIVGPFMNAKYEQRFAELSIVCKSGRWGQTINPLLTYDDIHGRENKDRKTASRFDIENRKRSVVRIGGTSKFDPTLEVKYGFIPILKSGKTFTLKNGPVFQLDGFQEKIKFLEEKCR